MVSNDCALLGTGFDIAYTESISKETSVMRVLIFTSPIIPMYCISKTSKTLLNLPKIDVVGTGIKYRIVEIISPKKIFRKGVASSE